MACREGGLGKNVSVGCCLGGRKRQRAIAGGGGRCPSLGLGGGAGAECALSLQRNIPSRNSSHPPPSTPPALPTLAPWEAWNLGSFSGQKDPVTSHLLPWQQTVRSRAALPVRGRELSGRAAGAGMSSAPGPRASYSRLTCSKNRTLNS